MANLEVIIVGSGKRVRETALPAMQRLAPRLSVRRVFARTAKEIEVDGARYSVAAFENLRADDLVGAGLIYVAVGKDAVPEVLGRLARFDLASLDLLIDTPVVRFKHFRRAALTRNFRSAWVAEDVIELPWIETVRRAASDGPIGRLHTAVFWRSAFAYHGLATAKAMFGVERVRSARRRRVGGTAVLRELVLENDERALIVEPRDYGRGRLLFLGERGAIADHVLAEGRALRLDAEVEGDRVRRIRIGDIRTELGDAESELTRGATRGASVIALTESMKRVGFLRLLARIESGRGAYPIEAGLDDMVIDYHLEKFGRWIENPFTSARSGLGRFVLSTLSRAGG